MIVTTLVGNISSNDRSIQVALPIGFTVGQVVQIEQELMKVTDVTGAVIGVFKGIGGTQAKSHLAGAAVYAGDPTEFPTHGAGAPGAGVTAEEYANGRHHITTLKFDQLALGATGGAADKAMGALLYTLPTGAILIKGSRMSVGIYASGAAADADTPDVGLGTTVGSGAQALLSAVTGSENILTGQTMTNCTGTVTAVTVTTNLAIETDGDKSVYLNCADGWAAAANISAVGTVTLEWVAL